MKSTANRFVRSLFTPLVIGLWLVTAWSVEGDNSNTAPVGFIKEVTGSAAVRRNGHRSNVTRSAAVLIHDEFTTARASSIKISLKGGSELDIGESSSLTIDEHIFNSSSGASSTLVELLAGTLHSIVPFASGKTNFNLRTGNAVCGVRGTEFDTAYIVGKPCPGFPKCLRYTDVGVQRGVVEVRSATNPGAKPVQVAAGYETTVPCEIPPGSPSPLGASELELPGYH